MTYSNLFLESSELIQSESKVEIPTSIGGGEMSVEESVGLPNLNLNLLLYGLVEKERSSTFPFSCLLSKIN